MIDLQKFCGDEDREPISKPFSRGDYTYATNGFLAVRVPRVPDIEENISAVPQLDDYFMNAPEPESWIVPVMEPVKLIDCPDCGGIGKMNKCPECDGEGEVYYDNIYNSYKFDCKTCDGDGVVEAGDGAEMVCSGCGGKGKVWPNKQIMQGRLKYTSAILNLIIDLPGIKIEDTNPLPYRMVRFSFDGGDGLIMPVRP